MYSKFPFFVLVFTVSLTVFTGTVARGECFSLFGISTCDDIVQEYPFTTVWWFVNVERQLETLQNALVHFDGMGLNQELLPSSLKKIWESARTGTANRFLRKIVGSFEANEEPTELLYDEAVDYVILQQSFHTHHDEILKFLENFLDTGDLDEELREFGEAYIEYIRFHQRIFRFAPDPTRTTLFKLFKQGIDLKSS